MMMTLSHYVDSRQTSLSTINRHIKRLNLDLPINPNDKRQKLVSTENQSRIDVAIGYQPSAAVETTVTVEPIEYYQRTEDTAIALAESSIVQAGLSPIRTPDQNPLVQALKQQLVQLEQQNAQNYQQLHQSNQSRLDTQAMVQAVDRLQITQRARFKAYNDHQLEQQVYEDERTNLDLQARGFTPTPPTTPPTRPLQPVSKLSEPSPSPEWF